MMQDKGCCGGRSAEEDDAAVPVGVAKACIKRKRSELWICQNTMESMSV